MMRRGALIGGCAAVLAFVACSGSELGAPLEPVTAPPQATEPCSGAACDASASEAPRNDGDGATVTAEVYAPCRDRLCGDSCRLCDPADEACIETPAVKRCGAGGVCSAAAPVCATQPGDAAAPDGEAPDAAPVEDAALPPPPPPPPLDPCDGKRCGDRCERCAPGDADCGKGERIGFCGRDGRCGRARPLCGRRDGGRPDPVE